MGKYFEKIDKVNYETFWCTDIETYKEGLSDALDKEIVKWMTKHKLNPNNYIFMGNDKVDHDARNNTYTLILRRYIATEKEFKSGEIKPQPEEEYKTPFQRFLNKTVKTFTKLFHIYDEN